MPAQGNHIGLPPTAEIGVAVSEFLLLTVLSAFVKKELLPICEAKRSSRGQIEIN